MSSSLLFSHSSRLRSDRIGAHTAPASLSSLSLRHNKEGARDFLFRPFNNKKKEIFFFWWRLTGREDESDHRPGNRLEMSSFLGRAYLLDATWNLLSWLRAFGVWCFSFFIEVFSVWLVSFTFFFSLYVRGEMIEKGNLMRLDYFYLCLWFRS